MTAPLEIVESIEHLAFDLACDACGKAAAFVLVSHACMQTLACLTCKSKAVEYVDTVVVEYGSIDCIPCGVKFLRGEDFMTPRPL